MSDRPRAARCGCEPWDSYDLHSGRCRYSTLEAELAAKDKEIAELREKLRKLANESSGFLALSDVERHGMTNSRILRQRIEEARDVLAVSKIEKEA